MTSISVRELNTNVSAVVARLEAGERLVLTKRGRKIADLIPPAKALPDLATISENRPLPKHSAEWQAARERLFQLLGEGRNWGGKATYEERTE